MGNAVMCVGSGRAAYVDHSRENLEFIIQMKDVNGVEDMNMIITGWWVWDWATKTKENLSTFLSLLSAPAAIHTEKKKLSHSVRSADIDIPLAERAHTYAMGEFHGTLDDDNHQRWTAAVSCVYDMTTDDDGVKKKFWFAGLKLAYQHNHTTQGVAYDVRDYRRRRPLSQSPAHSHESSKCIMLVSHSLARACD